jgi:hypothetical protein
MSITRFRADLTRTINRRRLYARINALPNSTIRGCWRSPSGTMRISDAAAHESRHLRQSRIPCHQRETLTTGNSFCAKGVEGSGR